MYSLRSSRNVKHRNKPTKRFQTRAKCFSCRDINFNLVLKNKKDGNRIIVVRNLLMANSMWCALIINGWIRSS